MQVVQLAICWCSWWFRTTRWCVFLQWPLMTLPSLNLTCHHQHLVIVSVSVDDTTYCTSAVISAVCLLVTVSSTTAWYKVRQSIMCSFLRTWPQPRGAGLGLSLGLGFDRLDLGRDLSLERNVLENIDHWVCQWWKCQWWKQDQTVKTKTKTKTEVDLRPVLVV